MSAMLARKPVDDAHTRDVCKIGQGRDCCRYLTMGAKGWSCERLNPEGREMIDERCARGLFTAISINCEGRLSR
jgi:hypothetical protein